MLEETHISWQIRGKTSAALDSTALPTVPLDLDDWIQSDGFYINGQGRFADWEDFTILGVITSMTPEPATLSLLALGGLAVLRRKRR